MATKQYRHRHGTYAFVFEGGACHLKREYEDLASSLDMGLYFDLLSYPLGLVVAVATEGVLMYSDLVFPERRESSYRHVAPMLA